VIIVILIVSIAVLILIHELGHFLMAKYFKVKVEEFGIGFPPRLLSKKKGETRYSLNLLPLGGFVRLYGESGLHENLEERDRAFVFQPAWRRTLIIVAGVVMNFILGWFIISGIFMVGSEVKVVVTQVADESPAQVMGLRAGDVLVDYARADKFVEFINLNRGEETLINISRSEGDDSQSLSINVIPRLTPPEGEGALGVGIAEFGIQKLPILESVWEGLKRSVFITGAVFRSLGDLFLGFFRGVGVPQEFVGPVGIYTVAAETSRLGYLHLMQLIAIISLNLAVLNILPIPALDGGRLLFIIIEKIRGKPVKRKRETISHAIGFLIMILLLIAITVRDVANLL
jgi:regulator of sigma E protease